MTYAYIYLTAWLFCNTILLILAIRSEVNGGVYFFLLLFALLTGCIRLQVKSGGAEDAGN